MEWEGFLDAWWATDDHGGKWEVREDGSDEKFPWTLRYGEPEANLEEIDAFHSREAATGEADGLAARGYPGRTT